MEYMKTLIAKPVIKNQYWVVTDGDKKVGNVIANGTGVDLKINGINTHYTSTTELKRSTRIEFQTLKTNKTKIELPFSHYPTTEPVHNSILDIKRRVHLYTKTSNSKCFYVAGWFVVDQSGENEIIFCPKYIFIQRYKYSGPYKTRTEAENVINNL
jgi:hypothetical protein